jgi:hypothetical protein
LRHIEQWQCANHRYGGEMLNATAPQRQAPQMLVLTPRMKSSWSWSQAARILDSAGAAVKRAGGSLQLPFRIGRYRR